MMDFKNNRMALLTSFLLFKPCVKHSGIIIALPSLGWRKLYSVIGCVLLYIEIIYGQIIFAQDSLISLVFACVH